MIKLLNKKYHWIYIGSLAILLLPLLTNAQEFVPLVDIPFIDKSYKDATVGDYIRGLYQIAITVAAFLAVVKIIFGGVKYMVSDVITDKSEAKKDIKGALLGLLIVLAAVLILNTIWSGFTDFAIFKNAIPTTIDYQNDLNFHCQLYPSDSQCQADPTFLGNFIDTSISYTVNQPADPDQGLDEPGPLHGTSVQITGNVTTTGMVPITLGNGDTAVVHCSMLQPVLQGCN